MANDVVSKILKMIVIMEANIGMWFGRREVREKIGVEDAVVFCYFSSKVMGPR